MDYKNYNVRVITIDILAAVLSSRLQISVYKNRNTRVAAGVIHTCFYFSTYKNCNTKVAAIDMSDWLLVFAFSLIIIIM